MTSASTTPRDHVPVFDIAANAMRHLPRVVGLAAAATVAVSIGILAWPRSYTSQSGFIPQGRRGSQGAMGGLAAQLGVMLPGADPFQGGAFYVELAMSRNLLRQLVTDTLAAREQQVTLVDWYHAKGQGIDVRADKAVDDLRDDMAVSLTAKTGVVHISVTLRDPVLATAVNQRVLQLINQFNLETRQSQAGSERKFTEQRLAQVREDLRESESRLGAFLKANREYASSPDLKFQYERLMREVSVQQQLYSTLAQSFEQAKIDEVRDTPVISIVESPQVPSRPDPRYLLIKACLVFLGTSLLGFLVFFARNAADAFRAEQPVGYVEYAKARDDAFASLRSGFRRMLRRN